MKILYLVPTLTGGGAERQLALLTSAMASRGHEVLVGYVKQGYGSWPAAIPTHHFKERTPWHPGLVLEVARLIRRWKPDLVQTSLPQMDVVGCFAAALTGVPAILREPTSDDFYGATLKSRLRIRAARAAHAVVVANSPFGQRYWAVAAPSLRTAVIGNAIPVTTIAETAPHVLRSEGTSGVCVARLTREKNVDVFIRACAEVMAGRDLEVWICGDGPDREELGALAVELGIASRIHFTGFVQDVWRYVRGSDFLALLSTFEGHPNAVLEAFAAGTPVILSDIAAHRAIAAGGTALLVPPGDAAAAARAIRQVLDDRDGAGERATAARHSVETLTIESMANAYEDIYDSIVPASQPRGLHIGIDGSNLRSGGPITHISELIAHCDPARYGIERVTLWGGAVTLSRVPERSWLARVHVQSLDGPLPRRVVWQLFERPRLTRSCDLLFAPGATPPRGFRPYVSMSRNMQPFDPRERRRYPLFSRARLRLALLRLTQAHAFRSSDAVIFLTEYARNYIGSAAGFTAPSAVIPHGVSTEFHHPPREAQPLDSYSDEAPFRFVYVSDIELYKHQWVVAEAVHRLRCEGLPVALDLIGGPLYPPAVQRLAETLTRLGPPRDAVRLLGPVAHDELPGFYLDAGAFVFASTCENLPISLIEAMAAGLPVASSSTRPMPDILGEGALYFEAEDVASVTAALRMLAVDPALRRRLAEHNFAAARNYSWQRCTEETFSLLVQTASNRRIAAGVSRRPPRTPTGSSRLLF